MTTTSPSAPEGAVRIAVGIGPRKLESADGGRTWREGTRKVPADDAPRIVGVRPGRMPSVPAGWTLSDVQVLPEGLGLAVGCEPVQGQGQRTSVARFFITRDGGVTWHPLRPDIGLWGRWRAGYSWPPEAVDFIAVVAGGLLAFTWEDPWIYDGSKSHTVVSADAGSHWRYTRKPGGRWLALGPGPLRACGGTRLVAWTDAGFRHEDARVTWRLPAGYIDEYGFTPRVPRFATPTEGFALVVNWSRDRARAPLVGLARTLDGGRLWEVTQTWDGPMGTDINRRHMLTLDVQP